MENNNMNFDMELASLENLMFNISNGNGESNPIPICSAAAFAAAATGRDNFFNANNFNNNNNNRFKSALPLGTSGSDEESVVPLSTASPSSQSNDFYVIQSLLMDDIDSKLQDFEETETIEASGTAGLDFSLLAAPVAPVHPTHPHFSGPPSTPSTPSTPATVVGQVRRTGKNSSSALRRQHAHRAAAGRAFNPVANRIPVRPSNAAEIAPEEDLMGWPREVLNFGTRELNSYIKDNNLNDDQVEELKSLRRRLKNRVYASTARSKRKDQQKSLQSEFSEIAQTKEQLQREVLDLRAEVEQLRHDEEVLMQALKDHNVPLGPISAQLYQNCF